MNRFFSTLAVLLMFLIAVAICVYHTYEIRETLDEKTPILLFTLEAVAALGILSAAFWLTRTEYILHREAIARARFEIVQPLRRLLSTVWS